MADKSSIYTRAARAIAQVSGRPVTFLLAIGLIVVWLITGPIFDYSDTWQLVINTGTTIITFLMVFLIQNTQNRDTMAIQLKLDELIRSTKGAHNALMDLEELDEKALESFRAQFEVLARSARHGMLEGRDDTDSPERVTPAAPPAASASPRRSRSVRGQSGPSAGR